MTLVKKVRTVVINDDEDSEGFETDAMVEPTMNGRKRKGGDRKDDGPAKKRSVVKWRQPKPPTTNLDDLRTSLREIVDFLKGRFEFEESLTLSTPLNKPLFTNGRSHTFGRYAARVNVSAWGSRISIQKVAARSNNYEGEGAAIRNAEKVTLSLDEFRAILGMALELALEADQLRSDYLIKLQALRDEPTSDDNEEEIN